MMEKNMMNSNSLEQAYDIVNAHTSKRYRSVVEALRKMPDDAFFAVIEQLKRHSRKNYHLIVHLSSISYLDARYARLRNNNV